MEDEKMLLGLLLFFFGVYALVKGEFKVTSKRIARGYGVRILGLLMMVGAGLSYQEGLIGLIVLIIAIIVGLLISKPVVSPAPAEK
jgi:hypothetical protein